MSPQRKSSRRGTGWKPPRDRREIVTAVLASLAVIVVTASLIWFLRPNRDSGTSVPDTVATSTTTPGATTTTASGATTTVPPTSAPASSTP